MDPSTNPCTPDGSRSTLGGCGARGCWLDAHCKCTPLRQARILFLLGARTNLGATIRVPSPLSHLTQTPACSYFVPVLYLLHIYSHALFFLHQSRFAYDSSRSSRISFIFLVASGSPGQRLCYSPCCCVHRFKVRYSPESSTLDPRLGATSGSPRVRLPLALCSVTRHEAARVCSSGCFCQVELQQSGCKRR